MHTGYFKGCLCCTEHCCTLKRGDAATHVGLSEQEFEKIKALTGRDDFATHGGFGFEMKINENGQCIFAESDGCPLGQNRPLSCKIYPYGLLRKDGQVWLFRWENICPEGLDWDIDDADTERIYEMFLPLSSDTVFEYHDDFWDVAEYKLICVISDDKLKQPTKSDLEIHLF